MTVTIPGAEVPTEMRESVEKAGNSCPAHVSLHPEVDAPIVYRHV